jgi:hypothetical protein
MLTPDLAERIRSIFLQTEPDVSLKEMCALFTGFRCRVEELMAEKEIQTHRRRGAPALARGDLMALAVDVWSLEVIEEALGEDAAHVLPAPLRLRTVTLNLPEYQIAMLDYLAADKGTTPGDLVSRALGDLEAEHFDVLVASVPGFAEAMNWFGRDDEQPPCSRQSRGGSSSPS